MSVSFTTHVRRRASARNLSAAKMKNSLFSSKQKYLGRGKYKAGNPSSPESLNVIYKKEKGTKIVITAWKD